MARRKQKKIPPSFYKIGGVVILAGILGFVLYRAGSYWLLESESFKVKTVYVDPSLAVINPSALERLKGQNIFKVDLNQVHELLTKRYPQVAKLRVIRQFPDQISIEAKERRPRAQAQVRGKVVTLDEHGVVLSMSTDRDEKFPFIKGVSSRKKRLILGQLLTGREMKDALAVIRTFQENRVLESFAIQLIDVANLSKIELVLSNGLTVYVDSEQLARKMRVLGFVLTRASINYDEVKYLDLRFQEPVIGKK